MEGALAHRSSFCRAFGASRSFLGLPRAALRAETGPSLALGYFDIAPSALKDEGINGQTPGAALREPHQRLVLFLFK